MNSNLASGLTIAVLALALVIGGIGVGIALSGRASGGGTTTTATTTVLNSTANTPYVLTLVIATNNIYNATAGDMPAYYVLGPHGLESSAQINLPANRLIELVIINNDDGNASLVQSGAYQVQGTTGNTIFVASNDNINSSEGPAGISLSGGQTVSSVALANVSHTLSVPSLDLNVPIPTSSTVVAFFTIAQAGNYAWFCMTTCGDAAMATPGWMQGTLAAS